MINRCVAAVVVVVLIAGCSILPATPATPTATAAPSPVATDVPRPMVVAPPSPSPTLPTTHPTSTPLPIPATATPETLVVSAGGDGVFIRIVPEKPDRYKAWADGSAMVVVGGDRTVGGRAWKNVRDPDGNIGWIPSEYLKPAATPTPAAG